MVEVELDMDEEDELGGHEARGRSEADPSGEPMDEVDEGSDISGASEKTGASDDPAVVHEQPARR